MFDSVPSRPTLTLRDLERFDPDAPTIDGERRFCCPLPACGDKTVIPEHRSLSLNTAASTWYCHRCHAGGLLAERLAERLASRPPLVRKRPAVRTLAGLRAPQ